MDRFFVILLIGALVLGGFGALHYFLRGRGGAGVYRRHLPVSGRFRMPDEPVDSSMTYLSGTTGYIPYVGGSSADCGSSYGSDGGGCSDGGGGGGN